MLQIFDYLPVVSYAGVAIAAAASRELGSFALRKLGVSIIRENGKGENGESGKKTTSFWQNEIRSQASDAFDNEIQKSVIPILSNQTQILARLADSNDDIRENMVKLVTLAEVKL